MPGVKGEKWAVELDTEPVSQPVYYIDEQVARAAFEALAPDASPGWDVRLLRWDDEDRDWECVDRGSDRRSWEVTIDVTKEHKITVNAASQFAAMTAVRDLYTSNARIVVKDVQPYPGDPDDTCGFQGCVATRKNHEIILWHRFGGPL